jgi:hypothetical protein
MLVADPAGLNPLWEHVPGVLGSGRLPIRKASILDVTKTQVLIR